MRFGWSLLWMAPAPFAFVVACRAELDTTCVGGTCEPLPPSAASSTITSSSAGGGDGSGGSGGAGGGGSVDPCFSTCDTAVATTNPGQFPCAVETIIVDNCQRCHSNPTKSGAPFALDTYESAQQLYAGTVIFSRVKGAVESKFMPLSPPALTDDEITTLSEWACACAPSRAANEACP